MEVDESESVLPNFKDINDFSQQSSRAVMLAIRASHRLPTSGDDYDYYQSFDQFRRLMDIESTRILDLMQQIMRYQGLKGNLGSSSIAREIEDKFDILVDGNDQLLERAGSFLDEASGIKKDTPLILASITPKSAVSAPSTASWNRKVGQLKNLSGNKSASLRLLAAKNIQRPQLKFKDKVDNSHNPFLPKIKSKPNALKSLQESFTLLSEEELNIDEKFSYPHPYQYELDHFTPSDQQLDKPVIQEPSPIDDCPATLIDKEEDLNALCQRLKSEREIAVDLEHHSYRSYLGITCLMQISTRSQDYLIDTLELRHEMYRLLDVFTNPQIVKVFHGSDSDIDWLQRDFGLYVVNMFDTHQASRTLGFPRHSLAHLLQHYCGVEADKQFQLADWRMRPLPQELLSYAQEDTHYLLHIYDRMRTDLIDRGNEKNNLLLSVISRSTQIAAKTYSKPVLSGSSHMEMYRRSKKLFNSQQMAALKGVYEWRDRIARNDDESIGYVLPNHMLLQIAMLLPREPQGVLACCNPVPPLVRQNLNEIHSVIKRARETPLHKIMSPATPKPTVFPTHSQHPKYNVMSLLHCPHDLSKQRNEVGEKEEEKKKIDPKLVSTKSSLFGNRSLVPIVTEKESPTIAFFSRKTQTQNSTKLTAAQEKAKRIAATFTSPFEKYLPLKKGEVTKMADISETVKLDDKQAASGEKWRLLPHTEVQNTAESTCKAPAVDTTVDTGSGETIEFSKEDPEDHMIPVRFMLPKRKVFNEDGSDPDPVKTKQHSITATTLKSNPSKSKTSDSDNKSSDSTNSDSSKKSQDKSSSKRGNKRRSDREKIAKEEVSDNTRALDVSFQAHDYTSADYNKMFQDDTSSNQGKYKQGKKWKNKQQRDFDPQQGQGSQVKHGKKPKFSSKDSKKSMTYNKNQAQMPKINWPKR